MFGEHHLSTSLLNSRGNQLRRQLPGQEAIVYMQSVGFVAQASVCEGIGAASCDCEASSFSTVASGEEAS